jgi:hypothetical protein
LEHRVKNLIAELEEASQESGSNSCKVCSYLATLPDSGEAISVDNLIRARAAGKNKISGDRVAAILKSHGAIVGSTTVRRHRTHCAPILPTS